MIIQRLPYILFRDYKDFGYLTDNRNFGYDTAAKSRLKVGDLLLSKIGSVFYSKLLDTPQEIEDVITQLCELFPEVQSSIIREDAFEFFQKLYSKGFIYCGDALDFSTICSKYFLYNNTQPYELSVSQENNDLSVYENTFGKTPRLTRVHIDISSRCNERCIHCYIPASKKCSTMTDEMFYNILHQCIEMNVLNLTISGGEPMLNPHLNDFLLKSRENNFSVNLLSNLTLLTDDLLDIIANNPLVSVQTSLYAMDANVHDTITGNNGSYQKTLSAIKLLHEKNVPLQINCPIMKQNYHHYKDVIQFAHSLNIEADSDYSLFGCYDLSRSNLSCRLSIEEIESIIEKELLEPQKRENIEKAIENKRKEQDDQICPVCKNALCISNTGNVYPCEGWQSLTLGSLSKQSLKEIWEGAPETNHLRNLTFRDFPKCNACADKKFCNTCLIMNTNESCNGNYTDINDFQCKIAKLKHDMYQKSK